MKNQLIVILLISCGALALLQLRSCYRGDDFEHLYNASVDSLNQTRNALGQQVTKTTVMEGNIASLKKLNDSKDSTLRKLKDLVDKKTTMATILSTSTAGRVTSGTTITHIDTVFKDSLVYVYGEYSTKYENRWEKINVVANKDSIAIDYKVFNEFAIKQAIERDGLWKKKQMITVTNLNPNTETKELKSFSVPLPKQRKSVLILSGIITGIIITKTISR